MNKVAGFVAVAAAALLVLAGCASKSTSKQGAGAGSSSVSTPAASTSPVMHVAVGVAQTSVGAVLTDSHGMTIYRFAPDPRGASTCVASCLSYWPAVPAAAAGASAGGSVTATIGSVTRPDGSKQLSVDGYPVYTYVGDKSAGTIAGQGMNTSGGLWWVLSPSGAEVTTAPAGGASSSAPPSSAAPSSSKPAGGYGGGY